MRALRACNPHLWLKHFHSQTCDMMFSWTVI